MRVSQKEGFALEAKFILVRGANPFWGGRFTIWVYPETSRSEGEVEFTDYSKRSETQRKEALHLKKNRKTRTCFRCSLALLSSGWQFFPLMKAAPSCKFSKRWSAPFRLKPQSSHQRRLFAPTLQCGTQKFCASTHLKKHSTKSSLSSRLGEETECAPDHTDSGRGDSTTDRSHLHRKLKCRNAGALIAGPRERTQWDSAQAENSGLHSFIN